MKCKICGKNEADGVCSNCFALLGEMDKRQLERAGCQVKTEFSLIEDVGIVDRCIKLSIPVKQINAVLIVGDGFIDREIESNINKLNMPENPEPPLSKLLIDKEK